MRERPELNKELDSATFRSFYYLKQELAAFCKEYGLPASGSKAEIGGRFEYNTYIRDFFADNPRKSLHDAIKCWNYKKGLPGHHRHEQSDLRALD